MTGRTALIAGGGIAGMAAALGLARDGWRVTVFERRPEATEVGAGLQMAPNASRVLRTLGVLKRVREVGFVPEAAQLLDGATGAQIYRAALGDAAEARWGAPYLHVHRADLLRVLTEGAEAAGAEIVSGVEAVRYLNRPEDTLLELGDGERPAADLVIGADGIGSALRTRLNGAEEPRFTGQVAWRALVPAERLPDGLVPKAATVWAGSGQHIVTYWLRGGTLVNLVAVEERDDWTAEGWSAPGDPADLRARFHGWHAAPQAVIDAVEHCFQWGLFDRSAQVRWTDGRVALIGDAAHPMLPFMAAGAGMALEDAAALVQALRDPDREVSAGLAAWEEARWHRVTRVQETAAANGRLFHLSPGLRRTLTRVPIALVSRVLPGFAAGRLDWLYGFDATR